jgi:hypothetical protein
MSKPLVPVFSGENSNFPLEFSFHCLNPPLGVPWVLVENTEKAVTVLVNKGRGMLDAVSYLLSKGYDGTF